MDLQTGNNLQFSLNYKKKTKIRKINLQQFEHIGGKFNADNKVLHTCWNPKNDSICGVSQNCIFIYNGVKKTQ